MAKLIRLVGRVLLLVLVSSAAIGAIWSAWRAFVIGNVEFVNVFAGSAAVIAAAISAFVALRSAELTEERLRPYPYPYIDSTSRYGLAQLRVRNVGGTAAHDVYLEWTGESIPKVYEGHGAADIPLLANGKDNAVAVLLPYESVAQALNAPHKISEQAKKSAGEWKGLVHFKDSRGQKHQHPFCIDMVNFGRGLLYDSEEPKTLYELQKLPKKFDELTRAVRDITRSGEFENSGNVSE